MNYNKDYYSIIKKLNKKEFQYFLNWDCTRIFFESAGLKIPAPRALCLLLGKFCRFFNRQGLRNAPRGRAPGEAMVQFIKILCLPSAFNLGLIDLKIGQTMACYLRPILFIFHHGASPFFMPVWKSQNTIYIIWQKTWNVNICKRNIHKKITKMRTKIHVQTKWYKDVNKKQKPQKMQFNNFWDF